MTQTAAPATTTEPTGFRRELSLLDATNLVVGTMIGSGIFIVSADIARQLGSPGWLLLVWLVAGVMTLLGALAYAELAAAMPRAGGQYVFLREGLGHLPAFLYGWTMFTVIQTGTIAAVAVAFSRFLGVFLPAVSPDVFLSLGRLPMPGGAVELGLSPQRLVGIAVIITLTLVNLSGLREAKWVQNIFTFAKTAALIGLIVLGITIGRQADALSANFGAGMFDAVPVGTALVLAFSAAMVGALFSADSWNNVTFAAAEVRQPERNLPRALAMGTGLVTMLYLLANFAYLSVLTLPELQNAPQDRVGTLALQHMFGDTGQYLMAAAILVSTFGCINGLVLSGARVYYAMARDGLFFARAGVLSSRNVPAWALVAQGIWTAFLALTGTYGQLLDYVIFANLIFYAATTLALFRLRQTRPDLPRPYRAVGYPVLPGIYLTSAVALAITLLFAKPVYTFSGLALVLLGIPVYFLWRGSRT